MPFTTFLSCLFPLDGASNTLSSNKRAELIKSDMRDMRVADIADEDTLKHDNASAKHESKHPNQ
jgi:hypothetical protein